MNNLSIDLYKKMYLIRMTEERIREEYPKDEIKSPVHLAIGEEAIAAGVCSALKKDDQVFGTYRNHGIYLAKTGNINGFFAELYGKDTGLSKGKGGSMHIMDPQADFLGTSAVVASTIPIAVGCAFANHYQNNNKTVVVFFGDGAIDEGAFWESINLACLLKLRILFICEDNDYAIHSKAEHRHGYKSIHEVVDGFDCHLFTSDSTDVEKIYTLTQESIDLQNEKRKPVFMYLKYYRYLQHVGMNQDFKIGYRSEEEYQKWFKKDPLALQQKKLLTQMTEAEVKDMENNIVKRIDQSIQLAHTADFPAPDELLHHVYYE